MVGNFKETQLDAMRPGQQVTVAIDAYPERALHGHVASVQPGSGTAFSLLPAENATGNYVKVVQRVPVKIVLESADGRRAWPRHVGRSERAGRSDALSLRAAEEPAVSAAAIRAGATRRAPTRG